MNVPRVAALPVHTPETLAVGALAETIWPRDAAAQPAVRALHSAINTAIASLIRTLPAPANKVGSPRHTGLSSHRAHPAARRRYSNAKIFFQSAFMSTIVQPRPFASSSALSSRPTCDWRSYAHSRAASGWWTGPMNRAPSPAVVKERYAAGSVMTTQTLVANERPMRHGQTIGARHDQGRAVQVDDTGVASGVIMTPFSSAATGRR